MEKPAETRFPIHDLLRQRWSPRVWADRKVEPATLASLFEAARWAPSSYNGQPWSFIVATQDQPEEFQRLLACLIEFNQGWAKTAPVLVLSVARLQFDHNQKDNAHAWHDVGLASMSLMIEATARGLHVHAMAGYDPRKARQTYGIPDGYEPVAAMAIGYIGDPQRLPDELMKREFAPRERKPLEQQVFTGRFGESAPFVQS